MYSKRAYIYLFLLIIALVGCRSKKEAKTESIPEDAWIALRIAGQGKGMAGFLVPLSIDRNDPDWVFREGIYCRDAWDMKRAIEKVIKNKPIITERAISFLPSGNVIFENYNQSTRMMLEKIEGKEPPLQNRLPYAKGDGVFFCKIRGQVSTSAGWVLSHINRRTSLDEDLAYAVYVPNISEIHKYFPIQKIFLMAPISRTQNNVKSEPSRLFVEWTENEFQILKKVVEKHGGRGVL